jgi:hypothetical protein
MDARNIGIVGPAPTVCSKRHEWLEKHLLADLQQQVLRPEAVEYTITQFGEQLKAALGNADFHDLSPRDFHYHSPTPGFCFLSFYQFSSSKAIIHALFVRKGSASSP